nr:hypothetical transcript [Hymenolepis microstoma]
MHPIALTRVSQQIDADDVMSFGGIRRRLQTIELASNDNSAFCYESSTTGAYFEGVPNGAKGVKGLNQ